MEQTGRSNSKKRSYQQPVLKIYGTVKALTAGGTGQSSESAATPAHCAELDHKVNPNCPSDRSLKENIVCVGAHPLGIGLYLFNFKPAYRGTYGHGRQFGVMADEVERVLPGAVHLHPGGYKLVDYGVLGVSRTPQ